MGLEGGLVGEGWGVGGGLGEGMGLEGGLGVFEFGVFLGNEF